MDITGNVKKLLVCFYANRFKTILKKRPFSLILKIKITRVAVLKKPHKFGNPGIFFLAHQKVKMVGHQTKSNEGDPAWAFLAKFC